MLYITVVMDAGMLEEEEGAFEEASKVALTFMQFTFDTLAKQVDRVESRRRASVTKKARTMDNLSTFSGGGGEMTPPAVQGRVQYWRTCKFTMRPDCPG